MRKLVLVAVMAALVLLGACAGHDPNLLVRDLREVPRGPADYTLTLKTYDLDAKGDVRLVSAADASLAGFVSRTMASKGYTLKTAGVAKYTLEAHLLCANPLLTDMGLRSEEVRLPAEAVGGSYHPELHYWLPGDADPNAAMDSMARRDKMAPRRYTGGMSRPDSISQGGAGMTTMPVEPCQGRVLLLLSPTAARTPREVFVVRGSTADCAAKDNCPVSACRSNLERELVDLIDGTL